MKSAGIIGGLGPETTSEFYLEIIFGCQKLNDVQRPSVVISSVPLLYKIENDLIAANTGEERYIPYLVDSAHQLEKAGADFIVMPCNSLHAFINELRDSVSIPVLSIVEETVAYLNGKGYKNIGLISTSATVKNRVYEDALIENGITHITPDGLQKAKMDKIIQHLVAGRHINSDREKIHVIVHDLAMQKVDAVALACTDLQLLLPKSEKVEIFDTMKLLADATVREILS